MLSDQEKAFVRKKNKEILQKYSGSYQIKTN